MREYYDRRAADYDQTTSDGLDPQTAAALAREGVELGARVIAAARGERKLHLARDAEARSVIGRTLPLVR